MKQNNKIHQKIDHLQGMFYPHLGMFYGYLGHHKVMQRTTTPTAKI